MPHKRKDTCPEPCNFCEKERERRRVKSKKFRLENPEKAREQAKKHRAAAYARDPQRVIRRSTEWQKKSGYSKSPKRMEYMRRWKRKTYKARYAKNPEIWKRSKKKHRATESGRLGASRCNDRRRFRVKNAYVEDVDVFEIAKLQAGLCYLCSEPMREDITLDHVIPLNGPGLHKEDNCAAAHGRCNSSKRDLSLLQYMIRSGGNRVRGVA